MTARHDTVENASLRTAVLRTGVASSAVTRITVLRAQVAEYGPLRVAIALAHVCKPAVRFPFDVTRPLNRALERCLYASELVPKLGRGAALDLVAQGVDDAALELTQDIGELALLVP